MRYFHGVLFVTALLGVASTHAAEADADDPKKEQDAAPPAAQPAAPPAQGLEEPVLKPRPPLTELPKVQPKKLDTRPAQIPRATKQPATNEKPKNQRAAANADRQRQPRPPFWNPRQQPAGLSPAAVRHLESMGTHVQLSPALRYYMNRSSGAGTASVYAPPATTSVASRQQAPTFYPGVSRLPPEKPFENIAPQPNAFQRYWPLLLEGREDRNTGVIIWRLP